jgi:hydroxymethylbilane synthase
VAGFLPREDARDVLVLRTGVVAPATIATGSPRRQLQVARLFPAARFTEIRGNVDTRLRKVADGLADATILAQAGLNRLGIQAWPGVVFHPLEIAQSVPAVGQGAIAIQCRTPDAARFAPVLDAATGRPVQLERAIQAELGGGCQIAFGAHALADRLYFFHEKTGARTFPLAPGALDQPAVTARRVLAEAGFAAT